MDAVETITHIKLECSSVKVLDEIVPQDLDVENQECKYSDIVVKEEAIYFPKAESEYVKTDSQQSDNLVEDNSMKKEYSIVQTSSRPKEACFVKMMKNISPQQTVSEQKLHYSKNHQSTEAEERQFSCEVCNMSFNCKGTLRTHYLTHTTNKPYFCDVCAMKFCSQANLRSHRYIHTQNQRFSCDLCGLTFSRKSSLKAHFHERARERLFYCTVCNKGFYERSHLSSHLVIHTGEKTFTCCVCGKAFNKKKNMELHRRTHMNKAPHNYTCDVCKAILSCRYSLNIHMLTHMVYHTGSNSH